MLQEVARCERAMCDACQARTTLGASAAKQQMTSGLNTQLFLFCAARAASLERGDAWKVQKVPREMWLWEDAKKVWSRPFQFRVSVELHAPFAVRCAFAFLSISQEPHMLRELCLRSSGVFMQLLFGHCVSHSRFLSGFYWAHIRPCCILLASLHAIGVWVQAVLVQGGRRCKS